MGFFKYIRHYLCLCKKVILLLFVSHCHCTAAAGSCLESWTSKAHFVVVELSAVKLVKLVNWTTTAVTAASVSFIKDNCSVTQRTLRKYYQLHLYRKWKGKWNHPRHIEVPMNCQNNNNKHTSEKPFFKVPCVLLLFSPETSYFDRNQIQVHSIWNCSWIINIFMFLE